MADLFEIEKDAAGIALTAPNPALRVSLEQVQNQIESIRFLNIDEQMIIAVLRTTSGFYVIGESAVIDPAKFNVELGQKISAQRATEKLWQLEGYRVKSATHTGEK